MTHRVVRAGVAAGLLVTLATAAQAQAQVSCSTAPFNFYSGSTTCVGFQSAASGGGATAVGFGANSSALNGLAVGFQAIASATNAIYLGARTAGGTGATAQSAIGIGTDVAASGIATLPTPQPNSTTVASASPM